MSHHHELSSFYTHCQSLKREGRTWGMAADFRKNNLKANLTETKIVEGLISITLTITLAFFLIPNFPDKNTFDSSTAHPFFLALSLTAAILYPIK